MTEDLEQLCGLLHRIEDPDRFNRPREYDRAAAFDRFYALTRRLERDFGPLTTALPPDGESRGLVSLTDPAVDLVVSKFGGTVSTPTRIPPQLRDVLLKELGFGVTTPLSALDRPAPGAEAHRPLDARTPAGLAAQIRALPATPPELGAMRSWLCRALNIPPEAAPLAPPDQDGHSLLVEAERLRAVVTAGRDDPEAHRWLILDDQILAASAINSARAIKHVLGVDLRRAMELLDERRELLRRIRPWAAAGLTAG